MVRGRDDLAPWTSRRTDPVAHIDESVERRGDHRQVRREHVIAALSVETAQACADGRKHRVAVQSGIGGEGGHAQERADQSDALEPKDQIRARGSSAGERGRVKRRDPDPSTNDVGASQRRDRRPDRRGIGEWRLDEHRPTIDESGEGITERKGSTSWSDTRSTRRQLAVSRIGSSAMVSE